MLPNVIEYPHGIRCIDTEQVRKGMACCFLIGGGDEYAFIECGTALSVPGLLGVLDAAGIRREQVRYVVPTHVHLDHAGGAGRLLRDLPAARLVIHPRGARHMINPAALIDGAAAVYGAANMAALYGEILPVPESRVIIANDGFTLSLGGQRELRFIDAPGHARHHFAVWDETSRGWFTGDVFGLSYREFDGPSGPYLMPTTTPVQFEPDAWVQTLARLLETDPQWMYLTHYGRIGDVRRRAEDLSRGLDAYQRIGTEFKAVSNRQEPLCEALTLYSLNELARLRSPVDVPTARQLLQMDMDLNAQGLGVWLDRAPRAVSA